MTLPEGFVFVDEMVPDIRWDAKYATWDNFTGRPVEGYLANRIVGSRALCSALRGVSKEAATQDLGLLLWDGYRPRPRRRLFPEMVATTGRRPYEASALSQHRPA